MGGDQGMATTEQQAPGSATVAGEALVLDTPVRCAIQPLALRVRVPRGRPGVPNPKPAINSNRLKQLALITPGTSGAVADHG